MTESKKLGNAGEKTAVKYLKKQKYQILARNYVTSAGEADIICKRGEQLVFVEVKARSNDIYSRPQSAVNWRKQRRYCAIADLFIRQYQLFDYYVRFDVIEIVGKELNHIENAFNGNSF